MVSWPSDYDGAWTLAAPVSRSGVGLHSGDAVAVTLLPSERPGFFVSWDDAPQRTPVQLHPSQVRDSQLCTTLDLGDRRLATVEHLLAALAGTGVTHCEIRVNGGEVPLLDGSAIDWVEAIAEVGLAPAATARLPRPTLTQALTRYRGTSVISAVPADQFSVVGVIDFPQPPRAARLRSTAGGLPTTEELSISPPRGTASP